MFFGFYRTDGLTLSKQEWQKCDKEIPDYFKENGEYKEIVEEVVDRKGETNIYKGLLTVARARINDEFFEKLQWILRYYLESSFFVPNISFNKFETDYKKYMKQSTNEYLICGYTDFLFRFFDSRHFSVSFDPEKHDIKDVCETVESIFNKT